MESTPALVACPLNELHIIIVRHGKPDFEAIPPAPAGSEAHLDPPLSGVGLMQAKCVAEHLNALPHLAIETVVVSPLSRTLETALAIRKHLNKANCQAQLKMEEGLLEWTPETITPLLPQTTPLTCDPMIDENYHPHLRYSKEEHTQESPAHLLQRAVDVLNHAVKLAAQQHIQLQQQQGDPAAATAMETGDAKVPALLIVAHCAVNIALVRALLGVDTWVPCDTASITHVMWDADAKAWVPVGEVGSTAHWEEFGLVSETLPYWGVAKSLWTNVREWGILA
eukprot:TRINITY_DN17978_c0_g1_i1.p1 TRINITY_DN17978_c0_g1~~TRINITY_DN17978_c0_g1_i1.p1  ORF type:complete len:282 (-),score=94.45 TRINITY_DN17978_c0_g1_i1:133-978(-)